MENGGEFNILLKLYRTNIKKIVIFSGPNIDDRSIDYQKTDAVNTAIQMCDFRMKSFPIANSEMLTELKKKLQNKKKLTEREIDFLLNL